ncbi:hypothetical protein VME0621_04276 [Vibrio mediterranei]|nr:hypothetical protein [Vibrio mediterranei]SBO12131.1 hypothetical protein VME0621_04276 [Vibrio mediterranei]
MPFKVSIETSEATVVEPQTASATLQEVVALFRGYLPSNRDSDNRTNRGE